MTIDELLAAVNASGVTPAQLTGYLTSMGVLGTVAAKQAEIANARAARQATIDAEDAALAALAQELAVLAAARDKLLGG